MNNENIVMELAFLRESVDKLTASLSGNAANICAKLGEIAYAEHDQVAAPAIACADNTVTITCATTGATIYYTDDGSNPTTASTAYSEGISITETKTFKAIAVKLNMHDSEVTSASCEYVAPEA